MKEQFTNWFNNQLAESNLTKEEFLWGTMIVALLCASAHFLTMLVTRWGDSRATSKSWVFSALLHVGCVVGLVVFSPPAEISTQVDRSYEPVHIQGLLVEEEQRPTEKSELWDRVQPEELNEAVRSKQPERTPFELEQPARQREVNEAEELVSELSTQPEQTEAVSPESIEDVKFDQVSISERPGQIVPDELPQEPFTAVQPNSKKRSLTARTTKTKTEQVERVSSEQSKSDKSPIQLSRQLSMIEAEESPQALLKKIQDKSLQVQNETPFTDEPVNEGESTEATDATPGFARTRNAGNTATNSNVSRTSRANQTSNKKSAIEGLISQSKNALAAVDVPQPEMEKLPRAELKAIAPQPKNYQLRNLAKRRETARKNGGTDDSEQAVERSLAWLAKVQNKDGYWDADRYGSGQVGIDEAGIDRQHAGKQSDSGLTALAVLSFLGAGYTHEEGQYKQVVEKALRWLVRNQFENGYLGGNAKHYEKMYCHGMATYALAEAYGMRQDLLKESWLREPIEAAVQYVISQQNKQDGGWRYLKNQPSDMSMFGWQLMALKSAEISGIETPNAVKIRMVRFLKKRSLGKQNGLAGYLINLPPANSMTAEALFSKQMLGINRANPACQEAVEHLLSNLPSRRDYNLYYWYYGTLAMYQHGGQAWETWNGSLRDRLVADQRRTGEYAGSWDPRSKWSPYGGRIYSTAMSTLCLEVYYRFLPLYRHQNHDEAEPEVIPRD